METSDLRFACLLGHEKPKKLLREAAANNKLSHAYLFRGPDGVGKKRAALALAAFLNCASPGDDDSCGRCPSCRKYFSGSHPDLLLLEPDGAAIKIGQVRKLKEQLAFPPMEAKVRVIILEDVHTMRREAANSLLKTLEEPAPGNLLILTADLAGDILPTILSRCQVIPFGPLDPEEMAAVLVREHGLEDTAALSLAAVSEGSLGRALFLLQAELLPLLQEVVQELLIAERPQAEAIAAVFRLSDKGAALKENIGEFLALLRLFYRDLVLLAAAGTGATVVNRDMESSLAAAAERWPLAELHKRLRRLDLAEKQLQRNCSRSLVLETLFFDLL